MTDPALIAEDQRRLLDEARVGHLATVDAHGRPHVVPVCYALVDGVLYTPIDEKPKRVEPSALRRVRNLLERPYVCLTVDRYHEDWSRLAWVQLRGRADLVEDAVERDRATTALRGRYRQYEAMALAELPLIRLTIERTVGWSAGG